MVHRRRPGRRPREVLFEFVFQGAFVKVTALDPDSLVEVSMVGDPRRSEAELKRLAYNKLLYVLNRRRPAEPEEPPAGPSAPAGRRRGWEA